MTMVEEQVNEVQQNQQPDTLALANSFIVNSLDARAKAEEYLKLLDELEKDAFSRFEPIRQKAYAAYVEALDQKKNACEPFAAAKRMLLRRITDFDVQQSQIAAHAEIQAREIAVRDHEAFVEAQLAEAGNSGPVADAEIDAIINQPPPPAPIAVYAPPTRSAVTAPREIYCAEITDLKLVLEAIIKGDLPLHAVEPNMKYFHDRAKADKEHLNIPGVRAAPKHTSSYRPNRGGK